MYRRPSIERESFAERDTQTPAYVDGPCMYVSGSPYGDEGGQELRWRDKQIERGKQQEEEERERESILVRGTNNALIQASYTRAHY